MPVARAPFERSGVERQPVEMKVGTFGFRTNTYESVEFVVGAKRLIVSGYDREACGNVPLRFGNLHLVNGRTREAILSLRPGTLWGGNPETPDDKLVIDRKKRRATWSRPYQRPDGKSAVFSYSVFVNSAGTVTVEYDMGLSQKEALEQTKSIDVCSNFYIGEKVAARSSFGFGDAVHRMHSREEMMTSGRSQILEPVVNPEAAPVFNFEKGNDMRFWSVTFPRPWLKEMRIWNYFGSVENGQEIRGAMLQYPIADFRNGNPSGFAVKGEIVIDLGKVAVLKQPAQPPVGGIDFWAQDAVHVPILPCRNLLQNGNFEQDFKGWRWNDWGARFSPAEKLREEIVEEAKIGRHALLMRGTQPMCPSLCSAPMSLNAGQTYTVSCWAKSRTGKPAEFSFNVRSVSVRGKYFQFQGLKDFPRQFAGRDWERKSFTFVADAGGFVVSVNAPRGNDEEILIDAVQVEEGDRVTDYDEVPYVANLLSSNEYNDLKPGENYDLKLDVQAFGGARSGTVRVRIYNFYHETKFDHTYDLAGDAVLPLDVNPVALGKGVFVVRMDYESEKGKVKSEKVWTDYARFSVLEPHDGSHATAQFYANHSWYARVSRCMHYMNKFVEWGWNAIGGTPNHADSIKAEEDRLGIRNYVHPVTYESKKWNEIADRMLTPEQAKIFKGDRNAWKSADPEKLAAIEQLSYELAKECDPNDDIWTFWCEEEGWARKVGFDVHVKFVMAVQRGVRKAFAERGLPPPKFCESHGTSHYFNGRNYDAIDGYLKAANDNGFKYDVIAIHPYQNQDGGTLGTKDADVETQHLIDQMKSYGYPDSTPIIFSECFNIQPFRIPEWGADGWGDSYRCNTQCSQDRGNREVIMASSLARLYIIALKYWPKLKMVHPWTANPILDIRFSPLSFVLSVNTLAHLMPSPVFFGDAQPYGDIRGYCFKQGEHAVMPVWTTNHDVEWGVKTSPWIQMALPPDTRCYDLEGNERRIVRLKDGRVRVPLTPAPLFFVASEADALLAALRESVAEDPSTALALDVRPDLSGKVMLTVENTTKAVQRGKLAAGEREIQYKIAPRSRQTFELAKGTTEPMRLQEWTGRFSILPRPWMLKYFFVPHCGEKPDWATIPKQPLRTVLKDKTWANQQFKAFYKAAWNKDYFFIRIEVEDPTFTSCSEVKEGFLPQCLYCYDGGLEIYFDGFGDARSQGTKSYDLNDSRYDFCEDHVHRFLAVNWQLAQGTASATDQEIKDKLKRTFKRTAKGYVYEIAFAARYMAPIDLKPGTVAGFGIAAHDWNTDPKAKNKRNHATISNSTRPNTDLDKKPFLMPLMILAD